MWYADLFGTSGFIQIIEDFHNLLVKDIDKSLGLGSELSEGVSCLKQIVEGEKPRLAASE